jgi:hypothetical protein
MLYHRVSAVPRLEVTPSRLPMTGLPMARLYTLAHTPHAPAPSMLRAKTPVRERADRVGALASFLCAIHCASWPFLLALLPAIGATILASEWIERGFVVFATVLALASLLSAYRHHRRLDALALLGPGLGLIWFGSFGPWHHDLIPHAVLMTLGGLFIAFAHLRNLRLAAPGHRHGPHCQH